MNAKRLNVAVNILESDLFSNLNQKYDESNNENIYNRNKIRNEVIPYIKREFNQNIIKTINRLSNVAAEENEYMQKRNTMLRQFLCNNVNMFE